MFDHKAPEYKEFDRMHQLSADPRVINACGNAAADDTVLQPPARKRQKCSLAAFRRTPDFALQLCLRAINSPAGLDVLQALRDGQGTLAHPTMECFDGRCFNARRRSTVVFSPVPGKWGQFSKTSDCVFLAETLTGEHSEPGSRHCGICGEYHPSGSDNSLYIRRKRLGPAGNKRYAYFVGCKRCDRLRDAKRAGAPGAPHYHDAYLIEHDRVLDWYAELGPGRAPARPGDFQEWGTMATAQIVEVITAIFLSAQPPDPWFEDIKIRYADHPAVNQAAGKYPFKWDLPQAAFVPICMNETWTAPVMARINRADPTTWTLEMPSTCAALRRLINPDMRFQWVHDRYVSNAIWFQQDILSRMNQNPKPSDGCVLALSSRTGTGKSWAIARAIGARLATLGPANCRFYIFLPRVRLTESESEVIIEQLKIVMEEKRRNGRLGKWDRMPKVFSYLRVHDPKEGKPDMVRKMQECEVIIMSPLTYGLMDFNGILPPVAPGNLKDITVFFDEFETDAEMYTHIDINRGCLTGCLQNINQTCALAHTVIMTEAYPSYLGVAFAAMIAKAGDKRLNFIINTHMHAPKYVHEYSQPGGVVAELLGAVIKGRRVTPKPTTAAKRHAVFLASMSADYVETAATAFDLLGHITLCHVADPPRSTAYNNNPFDRAAEADLTHPDAVWNKPEVDGILGSCTIGIGVDSHAEGIVLEGSYVTNKAASMNSHMQHLGRIRTYQNFGTIACNRIGDVSGGDKPEEEENDPIITLIRVTEERLANRTDPLTIDEELAKMNDGASHSVWARVLDYAYEVRKVETLKHSAWAFNKYAGRASYVMHGIADPADITTEPCALAMGRAFPEIRRLTLNAPLPAVTELCDTVHKKDGCSCYLTRVGKGDKATHRLHLLAVCLNRFGVPLSNAATGNPDVDAAIALLAKRICGAGSYNKTILQKVCVCHCLLNRTALNPKDIDFLLAYCGAANRHSTACTGSQLVALLTKVAEVLNLGNHVLTRGRIDRLSINPEALKDVAAQCKAADPRVIVNKLRSTSIGDDDLLIVLKFVALSVGIMYGPDDTKASKKEEEEEEQRNPVPPPTSAPVAAAATASIFDCDPDSVPAPAIITIDDDATGADSDVDEELEEAITMSLENSSKKITSPAPTRMEDDEEFEGYDAIMEPMAAPLPPLSPSTREMEDQYFIDILDAAEANEGDDGEDESEEDDLLEPRPRFYIAKRGMLGARLPVPSKGPHQELDELATTIKPNSCFLKLRDADKVKCLDMLADRVINRKTHKVPSETEIFLPGTTGVPYNILPSVKSVEPPTQEEMIGPFTQSQLTAICEKAKDHPRAPERIAVIQQATSADLLIASLRPRPIKPQSLTDIMRSWIQEHPNRSPTKVELADLAILHGTTAQRLKIAYVHTHQRPT